MGRRARIKLRRFVRQGAGSSRAFFVAQVKGNGGSSLLNTDVILQSNKNKKATTWDGFDKKGYPLRKDVVGSGISETIRHVWKPNFFSDAEQYIELPTPWSENRALIVGVFGPIFAKAGRCPGRERPQCSQCQPDEVCYPKWKEREDPEWYAFRISSYLSQVDERLRNVTPVNAALAADDAFELGTLFSEALIKLGWDKIAKRGARSDAGSRLGGQKRRNIKRQSAQATVARVDALLAEGRSKKAAYGLVGEAQRVSAQTIAKEYKKAKNLR